MSRPLLAIAGLVVLAGLIVWWSRRESVPPVAPDRGSAAGDPQASAPDADPADLGGLAGRDPIEAGPPAVDPARPVRDPSFDGRVAELRGRVTRGDTSVAAGIVVVAGTNRGVELECEPDGGFVLDGLYPGLARIEIRERGVLVAEREVLLRAGRAERLEIDLATRELLTGSVVDASGAPLAGATVSCDGARAYTGSDGAFVLGRTAGGRALVRCELEGHASAELATWGEGTRSIRLLPSAPLAITVTPPPGGGPVLAVVVPTDDRPSRHPWNRINPLRAQAGEVLRLDALPAADVEVRAFAAAAHSTATEVRVRPGSVADVVLEWRELPVLTGVLLEDGAPRSEVELALGVNDPIDALTTALGQRARQHLRSVPFELLPSCSQRAVSDRDGGFRFALPELHRASSFVDVSLPAGRRLRRSIPPGATTLEIDLAR